MDQAEVCLNKTKKKSNPFTIWQICKFEPNSDTFLKSKIKKKQKNNPTLALQSRKLYFCILNKSQWRLSGITSVRGNTVGGHGTPRVENVEK